MFKKKYIYKVVVSTAAVRDNYEKEQTTKLQLENLGQWCTGHAITRLCGNKQMTLLKY